MCIMVCSGISSTLTWWTLCVSWCVAVLVVHEPGGHCVYHGV